MMKMTSFTVKGWLSLFGCQMSWAAGTQCVAKCRHKKPKPGELAFQKGDILTIVESSSVRSSAWGERFGSSSPKLIQSRAPSSAEEGPLPREAQRHRGGRTRECCWRAWEAGSARGPQSQPHAVCVHLTHMSHFPVSHSGEQQYRLILAGRTKMRHILWPHLGLWTVVQNRRSHGMMTLTSFLVMKQLNFRILTTDVPLYNRPRHNSGQTEI